MYLIQRGYRKNSDDFTGLTGPNGLIELDYMGAAEFEWGTIPASYRRIMGEYENYVFHKTKLINVNGCPLWLYCHKDKATEVERCISEYVKSWYKTKEFTNLDSHFSPETVKHSIGQRKFELKTNFWWDVEKYHDWMAFIGADDIMVMFKKAISTDYTDWWMQKPEEQRYVELKEVYRRSW